MNLLKWVPSAEGQQLYPELLQYDGLPFLISKEEPVHLTKKAHFSCFYPGSGSFTTDLYLRTIGEGWDKDGAANPEVHFQLCSFLIPEQNLHYCKLSSDPSIHLLLHPTII
ncbi:hypothetical protein CHARACLAT_029981 [Characodon lateralis]|uniref:Uncharacterized protein n=1 Tax=Characodon lateralis TaxID=208331 RepID=A0ABU7D2F9_9TELE|nr:hypothetical protein [Characodon lateralis]